jgi:hypothetical protein
MCVRRGIIEIPEDRLGAAQATVSRLDPWNRPVANGMNEEMGMKAGWMTMPLVFVATFAFLFAVGTSGAGTDADGDGDGVQDNMDNCVAKANADQSDTDLDGHGNACDGDFSQDGIVGGPDYLIFSLANGGMEGDAAFNHDCDCNNDKIIGGPDYLCFSTQNGAGVPGPSGRSCAVTSAPQVRCPDPGIVDMPAQAQLP